MLPNDGLYFGTVINHHFLFAMEEKKECTSLWPICKECGTAHHSQLTKILLIVFAVLAVFFLGVSVGKHQGKWGDRYRGDFWKDRSMMYYGDDRYMDDRMYDHMYFRDEAPAPAVVPTPAPVTVPSAPKAARPTTPSTTTKPAPTAPVAPATTY